MFETSAILQKKLTVLISIEISYLLFILVKKMGVKLLNKNDIFIIIIDEQKIYKRGTLLAKTRMLTCKKICDFFGQNKTREEKR
jgi:hypothetical protein